MASVAAHTDTPARRMLLFLTAALLGAALILGAWQGYRYERLLHAVDTLEQEQRRWHERNKQTMDAIVALRSPRRIKAAAADLGLRRIDSAHRLMVQLALPEPLPEPPARGGSSP